jgi:hypothetical protein
MKIFESFEDFVNEGYNKINEKYSSSDIKKLKEFATQVSDEINSEYDVERFADLEEYNAEAMFNYIADWGETNKMSAKDVIAEFDWTTITQELGLEESTTNEGKIVLKRQYGEKTAVTTVKETKVRNSVLKAVKDGKISNEEFKAIVNEFSADSKKWLNRNARYFSVSEDGVALSTYGQKVLSHLTEEEIIEEGYESILEGLKSSILANLTNMKLAPKNLLKYVYGYTRIQLDQITDADLLQMSPMDAYKRKNTGKELVFYVSTNQKENPYADSGAWSSDKIIPQNSLIAVANGQNEFMAAEWSGRWSSKDRYETLGTSQDGIGVNKKYKGYGASGLYNVKRIAEVSDTAYVLNVDALVARFSSSSTRNARGEARRGAIALVDPKRFKEENLARYKTILANRVGSDTDALDKMVEKAINDATSLLTTALSKKEIGKYGDIVAGTDPKGREVKLSDVTDFMKRVLDDYGRFVQYTEQAKEDGRRGASDSYYAREAKNYALSTKQRIQKLDKLDIAW